MYHVVFVAGILYYIYIIFKINIFISHRNHDMIAWYKTRNIIKEQRRRDDSMARRNKNKKNDYLLMDPTDDEFK